MKKVHLDFGHGGKDSGAVGNGLREKDIVLSMGMLLGEILKQHGVNVSYSRTTDVFVELGTRATMANRNNVDAFVSLHINSATNPKATGLEIWTSIGQTNADELATIIGEQLQKDFPNISFRKDMTDGDLDKEKNFTVVAKTNAPAVLVEYMFIVNPSDAQILRTKQKEFAESTAKGILKYLGIEYGNSSDKVKVNIKGKVYNMEGVFQNDKNYVGVRELAETLGHTVDWDSKNKVVVIK